MMRDDVKTINHTLNPRVDSGSMQNLRKPRLGRIQPSTEKNKCDRIFLLPRCAKLNDRQTPLYVFVPTIRPIISRN